MLAPFDRSAPKSLNTSRAYYLLWCAAAVETPPEAAPAIKQQELDAAELEMFARLAALTGTHYCVNAALVREGFDMASARVGKLRVGEAVEILEARVNENGTTRVRFARGWVSTMASNGNVILASQPAVSDSQVLPAIFAMIGYVACASAPGGEGSIRPSVYQTFVRCHHSIVVHEDS